MFRLIVILLLTTCTVAFEFFPAIAAESSPPVQNTNQQIYQVQGLVLEVKPQEKSVRIKHEDIPGYMKAMTMDFEVKDTNELTGIEAGDPVTFRMIVNDTYGWIEQIRKTGPKQNDLPTTGSFRTVREVQALNPGDLMPEYHFTNQLGQAFSTTQFKGQVLAINFLFTRCPFPTFCPQTARYFAEAQQKLSTNKVAGTNWHLLTISFDPEFDTPSILKTYAQNYHCDPQHWTFATGKLVDITAIGEQFGLTFWRDETGSLSHNLRTAVIDPSGKVQKIFIGNEWTSDELVGEILKATTKK
jgi:protein SCO1/2